MTDEDAERYASFDIDLPSSGGFESKVTLDLRGC